MDTAIGTPEKTDRDAADPGVPPRQAFGRFGARLRRLFQRLPMILAAVGLLTAACGQTRPGGPGRLHACTSDEGPSDAYCGTLTVFEDRARNAGRHIALTIVVLPALSDDDRADPLVFLAGGPGQGAAQDGRRCADGLLAGPAPSRHRARRSARHRPVAPAQLPAEGRFAAAAPRRSTRPRSHACASAWRRYDADPRSTRRRSRWTISTTSARFSATTRSTSTAARTARAPRSSTCASTAARVRAVVLDGVAPTDMRLPLFAARDAQRALDKLLADCERDAALRGGVSGPARERVRALLARLERTRRGQGRRIRAPATPRTVDRRRRASSPERSSSARCTRRSRRRSCRC